MPEYGEAGSQFIPVARPYIWGNEYDHVKNVIQEGWLSSRAAIVQRFERQFAEKLGMKYAVAVTNGTSALHLALVSLGIGSGDEVIVPDFCMISPIFAVLYCGARPITIDVDNTWNIDPLLIEKKITRNTRAILVVHTYGHPADMKTITEIGQRYGLCVIEDAAEALGATIDSRQVGTFGDVACFSFYANKTITTGEGGMLVTDSSAIADKACWKRDMCFGENDELRFTHQEVGYNYRMASLQAAIGLAQLDHLEAAIEAKIAIAQQYNAALSGIRGLTQPPQAAWAKNVFWVYGVTVEKEFGISRATLQEHLRRRGIETRRFFNSVHRQPFWGGHEIECNYPRSIHLSEHGFYLPSYIGLTNNDISRIVDVIRTV